MAANTVFDKLDTHVHAADEVDTHIEPITDKLIQHMKSDILFLPSLQTHINYWYKHAAQPANNILDIVFVPGNPGLYGFYIPMAERLYQLLGSRHNIHILSYAGFAVDEAANRNTRLAIDTSYYTNKFKHNHLLISELELHAGKQVYGLEAQCIALNDALLQIQHLQQRQCKYVLLAHSIGSYTSSQVQYRYLKNLQYTLNADGNDSQLQILHTFLCFPFIRFDLSLSQHLGFRAIYYLRFLVYALGYIIRMLPKRLLVKVATTYSEDLREPHALHSVLQMLQSAKMIVQWLYLGKTEFSYLPSDVYRKQLPQVISTIQQHTTLFYANKSLDHWGPLQQGQEFQQLYPKLDVRYDDECTHAFCCTAHMYNGVAQTICDKLAEITHEPTHKDVELSGNDRDVFITIAKHRQHSKL